MMGRRRGCASALAMALALVVCWYLAAQADAFVYWANFVGPTIARANLDGSGVNQGFITGASSPVGVAVDRQYVYWANSGGNSIGRANLSQLTHSPV